MKRLSLEDVIIAFMNGYKCFIKLGLQMHMHHILKYMCSQMIAFPIRINLMCPTLSYFGGNSWLQDDTTFEKQSALFALAVADVVLINM